MPMAYQLLWGIYLFNVISKVIVRLVLINIVNGLL